MSKKIGMFLISLLAILAASCPAMASEPAVTELPVICRAEGIEETFTYEIEPLDNVEGQEIPKNILSLRNNESDAFQLRFNIPGTYGFIIRQENGTNREVNYDDSVYRVNVYVLSNDDGELYTEIIAYIDGHDEKESEISFTNTPVKKAATLTPTQKPMPTQQAAGQRTERTNDIKTTSTTSGTTGTVKTGDEQRTAVYMVLSIISLITIIYILKKGRDRYAE